MFPLPCNELKTLHDSSKAVSTVYKLRKAIPYQVKLWDVGAWEMDAEDSSPDAESWSAPVCPDSAAL